MKPYRKATVDKSRPKNGDLIKCDRCRCAHRLSTAKRRDTSQMIHGTFLFNCNGTLRLAAQNFALKPEFEIIDISEDAEWGLVDLSHKGKRREERRDK